MTEAHGAEGRGSYFNSSGVIRDVMQNRKSFLFFRISFPTSKIDRYVTDMMQIITLLTMERPRSFSAQDLCDEKVRVLSWMPAIDHRKTIIGQYCRSVDDSKPAFKDEEDVPNESICATFCAAVAQVDNERRIGVPLILKAGKGLLLRCISIDLLTST